MTDTSRTVNDRGPGGLKRVFFTLLTLGLPVFLILCLELGLRAAGYGGYGHTFQSVLTTEDGRTLTEAGNDRVDSFFLRNRDLPGHLDRRHFFNPKPEGELRVIVVGESAIRGFPQPASLTATSILTQMLEDALPNRPIDVINLGATAIASYPILELGTEALEQDPDVVVVQAGNNEFFGAFGVASLNRAGNSPLAIAFQRWGRSLAIAQWAEVLGTRLRGRRPAVTPENTSETLMERMMGQEFTAHDDPIREAAARNIRVHVNKLIRRCERRGVPVVVCITGTNERGMAPLGESPTSTVAEPDRARFDALMQIDPQSAADHLEDLRWATEVAPTHARASWLLGQAQHRRGQFEEARTAFQRAVDLDPMPWRATSGVLAGVRRSLEGTDAVLVDAQEALRAASEGGSIAWDLMDDHVHMSLAGQAIVARAVFEGLVQVPSLQIGTDAVGRLTDGNGYAERLGRNIYDEFGVAYRMYKLLEVPFFTATNPWASGIMATRMQALQAQMTVSEQRALAAWQDPRQSSDYGIPASAFAGQVCFAERRYPQAELAYLGAARAIAPFTYFSLDFTARWLFCRQYVHGTLQESEEKIARAAVDRGLVMTSLTDGSSPQMDRSIGSLYALVGECENAVPYLQKGRLGQRGFELAQTDRQLVECLVSLGRTREAQVVIDQGTRNVSTQAPLYREMEQLLREGVGSPQSAPEEGSPARAP